MKYQLMCVALLLASASCQSVDELCSRDVAKEFTPASIDFDVRLYQAAAQQYENHFVISQYSTWLTLSGIAEGASEATQERLFNALHLPKEACLRAKLYKLVRKHERPCTDLKLFRRRFLAYDESLTLNATWLGLVTNAGLVTAVSAPLKSNPDLATEILSSKANTVLEDLCFPGNSLLLDTFDYSGLWSSSFPNAKIERNVPFFNDAGQNIAKVDMLRVKRRTSFAYVPELGIKMVQFAIDKKKHYGFSLFTSANSVPLDVVISMLNNTVIEKMFSSVKESLVPMEIAFPKFKITSYHDNLENVLERMGLWSMFNDPSATEYVSRPPASPGQYIQRIAVSIDVDGDDYVREDDAVYSEAETGLPKELNSAFVLNKPFIFALVNLRTKVCLFAGAYSQPYYPYV